MEHACAVVISKVNKQGKMFTCGACGETFSTICTLHQHVTTGHSAGGSYHYDDIIKVAFPKYDSTCSSTQTDELQTNYLQQIEFGKRFRLLADVKQEALAESDVNIVGEKFDSKPHGSNADALRKLVRNEKRVGNDIDNLLSTADSKDKRLNSADETHAVKKCNIRVQKLTEDELNYLLGDQPGTRFGQSVRSNSGGRNKTACSAISLPCQLSGTSPDVSKTGFDNPSVYVETDSDGDHDGNCDDSASYLAKHLQENTNSFGQNELMNEISFAKPETELFHQKNRVKNTGIEIDGKTIGNRAETKRCNKDLTQNRKEEKDMPRQDKMSVIKDFIMENKRAESELKNDKYDRDMDKDENLENGENLQGTGYFYGKIISKDFKIERIKTIGMFSKGEKDVHNKVFVDDTWLPVSELTNQNESSANKSILDEEKFTEREEFRTDKDSNLSDQPQEEVNSLDKKWNYKGKSKLVCNHCGKLFKRKQLFEGHMNLHAGQKPYMCQYCGKSYPKMSTLNTHVQHTHSDKSSWFKCSVCDKSFPTAARLKVHESTHSTNYIHICQTCNKSYKSLNLLKAHIRYSHNNKNFRCRNCRQSFYTTEERDLHEKVKHDIEIKCITCSREFNTMRSKQRHEKIHVEVKPHECHICHRRFLQKTPFWVHMEKHHDLTKTDLIRLFPERHLSKNRQHENKEISLAEQIVADAGNTTDLYIDDNKLI